MYCYRIHPGFGWDRVSFLHRGSCNAMFWMFYENSDDNKVFSHY